MRKFLPFPVVVCHSFAFLECFHIFPASFPGEKIADSECGLRAFSSKAINELKLTQNGFAIEAEMIAAAADRGLKIMEIPVLAIYTKDGSTLNPIVHGVGNLAAIITMISERRLLLFGLFSIFTGMILNVLAKRRKG